MSINKLIDNSQISPANRKVAMHKHNFNITWAATSDKHELSVLLVKEALPIAISNIFHVVNDQFKGPTSTQINFIDPRADAVEGCIEAPVLTTVDTDINKLSLSITTGQPLASTLTTLLHELQHCAQVYTGKLKTCYQDPESNMIIWKGKAFSTRLIDYEDYPWEIEAEKVANDVFKEVADNISFSIF